MKNIFLFIVTAFLATQSFADIACKGTLKDAEIRMDGNELLVLPKKMVKGDLSYILEDAKNLHILTYNEKESTKTKSIYTTVGSMAPYGTRFSIVNLDSKPTMTKEICVGKNVNPQGEDILRTIVKETRTVEIENMNYLAPHTVTLECTYYIDNLVDSCSKALKNK